MKEVIEKYFIMKKGLALEKENPKKAIEFYKELLTHEYFINDYYPYRRLVIMYKKTKEYDKKVNIIRCFFKSEIYCNKRNYLWFRNKLRLYSKKGLISQTEIKELTDYFKEHSLINKEISNEPVVIAERIKKEHGRIAIVSEERYSKRQKIYELEEIGSELKRQGKYQKFIELYNHMIDDLGHNSYRYYRDLCIAYRKVGELDNEIETINKYYEGNCTKTDASEKWFKRRSKEVSKLSGKNIIRTSVPLHSQHENINSPKKIENTIKQGNYDVFDLFKGEIKKNFSEFSNALGTEDEFLYGIPINQNFEFDLTQIQIFEYNESLDEIENIKRKIILREQGNQLNYAREFDKAIDFYESMKKNSYFTNDWYPYRQLTIIYDKTKNYEANLNNIKNILSSGIYLNGYQFVWFTNKIKNIMQQISVDENEIEEWLNIYESTGAKNKNQLNQLMCDRITKKDGSYRILNEKSFRIRQNIYEIDEIGRIYERIGNYKLAAEHYREVIQDPPKEFNEKVIEKYEAKLDKALKKI